MTSLLRVFGFSMLLLSIALAQTPAKVGTASITGKVLIDGKPAADVLVILGKNEQVLPSQVTAPPRTTTDASGQYRFSSLPAGKYSVNVAAQGYVNTKRQSNGETSNSLALGEGEVVESIDFMLVKSGVITGRVSDEQGRPVIEESLVLMRVEDNGKKVRVPCRGNTDDRGTYRCFNLLPGKYIVGAGRDEKQKEEYDGFGDGTIYARSWYPHTTEEEKAKVIEVSGGGEVNEIDLKLGRRKKGITVSGRVIATDTNKPVLRVMVGVSVLNEDNQATGYSGGSDSMTNADGEFRVLGLMPGKYKLTPMMYSGGEYFGEPMTIEVSTEAITGLEFKMERGSVMTGVAALEDPSNREAAQKLSKLLLLAFPAGDGGWTGPPSESLMGVDGSFTFKGVHPGKARIQLGGSRNDAKGFSITRVEHDGARVNENVEVKAGESVTGVRVIIGYGSGVIRGELKLENGPLPDGVALHLRSTRSGTGQVSNWIEVDARNRFVLEALTTGTYELTVETHATRPPWDKPALKLQGIKETVEVTNGQEAKVAITVDLSGKGGGK